MQKPVWRMNSGNPPPKDDSLYPYKIACANGGISKASMCVDWSLQDQPDDVVAYQTNRTRKAKYERVECDVCRGLGFSSKTPIFGLKIMCLHCNGKGYRLEAVK